MTVEKVWVLDEIEMGDVLAEYIRTKFDLSDYNLIVNFAYDEDKNLVESIIRKEKA